MISKGLFLLSAAWVSVTAGAEIQAQTEKTAVSDRVIVRAQGHPMLHGFEVMSIKRADLRLARATKPLDVAFTEWLRSERPLLYRQHEVEFFARSDGKQTEKRTANKAQKPQKRRAMARK